MKRVKLCVALLSFLTLAPSARALFVGFDGGTAYFNGGGSTVTSNSTSFDNVDYYEEAGFRLDFIGNESGPAFASHIGDYYSAGNAVIHSHWLTGDYGNVTVIEASKINGDPFDLNYFILTSNTDTGGFLASGNEEAYIHAWDATSITFSQLLPVEDWGFPATPVVLGPEFDGIFKFTITVTNPVDCFGMDEFYIDEEGPIVFPPNGVPEPMSIAVWLTLSAIGVGQVVYRTYKRRAE